MLTLPSRRSCPVVCPVAIRSLFGWTAKLKRKKTLKIIRAFFPFVIFVRPWLIHSYNVKGKRTCAFSLFTATFPYMQKWPHTRGTTIRRGLCLTVQRTRLDGFSPLKWRSLSNFPLEGATWRLSPKRESIESRKINQYETGENGNIEAWP